MTLAQIIKKHESGDMEIEIRRKAWLTEKQPYSVCYCSSGCFYTSKDFGEDHCKAFPFDNEDIIASDWEYSSNVWVSK